ncbi:MAG: NAD(P)/FAD-dependent oxidoreductase [Chloroflexi bacterium]|nr:NAD(P)/FAD-dependent oxidoreductase [Chloroflexota bacterium]
MTISSAETATTTPTATVVRWLNGWEHALKSGELGAVTALFHEDSYWRDLVSFTWNIVTVEGHAGITDLLRATIEQTKARNLALEGEAAEADGITDGWFTFETDVARGRGHVRLKDGTAWTLLTTMTELKGHEEKSGARREKGTVHGADANRVTWLERKTDEEARLGYADQPYVVVIGGGQGGIALGARLKRLNIPTIILDRNARPGDSWRNRYKSLCLHDPVWYDHLPYLPFPDHWPVFSPKDKIADWLEMYARVMELNYWGSAVAKLAAYDEAAGEWTIEVERDAKPVTLRPKHLVFATGVSGLPITPTISGGEAFEGDQHHSSQHRSSERYRGKTAVVIGSNNSAHDICADLWEHGADVTMVQRSSTHVSRSDTLMDLVLGGLYSEAAVASGITTDKADLIFASLPYRILPAVQTPMFTEMAKRDADFYARLEQAGFMHDFGEDGSGLFLKYLRRGSGYYIDVGASELVANGSIKLRSGVSVTEIRPHSVVLDDGSELPADLIVYATGYGSMNGYVAQIVSQEVADKVGKCWGLGSGTTKDPGPWEGELRNMWKPTRQTGLWFHGGNLHQSRHYSQFLSLQLKARMEGIPTPVYKLAEVHHAS